MTEEDLERLQEALRAAASAGDGYHPAKEAALFAAYGAAPSLISEVRRLRARVKELEERHVAYRDSILAEIARNG